MLSCRHVTRLISQSMDGKLGWPERWAMRVHFGRVVYTANAGSGSISGFAIAGDGSLQLLTADGQTGLTGPGSHPTDMAQSSDGRFLYSLNNGNGTISGFDVQADGSL